eukprot:11207441-Ditylum_brightwellii.AAC.1
MQGKLAQEKVQDVLLASLTSFEPLLSSVPNIYTPCGITYCFFGHNMVPTIIQDLYSSLWLTLLHKIWPIPA